MKLEELFPQLPEFTLKSTGKTYKLRIPNLEDKSLFRQWCGGTDDGIEKVFGEFQWSMLSRIIYRLMVDKSDFKALKEDTIDDAGNEVSQMVPGPAVFLRAIVGGQQEAAAVFQALVDAIRKGEPTLDEAMKAATPGEVKKKKPKSTGASSSTVSHPSTDTHQESLAV